MLIGLCALAWFVLAFIDVVMVCDAWTTISPLVAATSFARAGIVLLYGYATFARHPSRVRGVLAAASAIGAVVTVVSIATGVPFFALKRDITRLVVMIALAVYAHQVYPRRPPSPLPEATLNEP